MGARCSVSLRATHFSGAAVLRRRLPGRGFSLDGGSSQQTVPCLRLLCLLFATWERWLTQAKPPPRAYCQPRQNHTLWPWVPVLARSREAHSSCLGLCGSLLNQKLQQEGAVVPGSLCPLRAFQTFPEDEAGCKMVEGALPTTLRD